MGLASLGLDIGVFCNVLYGVLLFNAIAGLYFIGQDRASPNFMRLASLGLEICIFCDYYTAFSYLT
jgi:hypothetical protein